MKKLQQLEKQYYDILENSFGWDATTQETLTRLKKKIDNVRNCLNNYNPDYNKIRAFVSENAPEGKPSWKGNTKSFLGILKDALNNIIPHMEYNYFHANQGDECVHDMFIRQLVKILKEEKAYSDLLTRFPFKELQELIKEEFGHWDLDPTDWKEE